MLDLRLLAARFRVFGAPAVVGQARRLLSAFLPPSGPDGEPDAGPAAGPVRQITVRALPGGFAVTVTEPGTPPGPVVPGPCGTDELCGTDVPGALARVVAALNAAALAQAGCLAVHAGVVARDGRAVAFPAGSGQGKSTLTAALLRAGWDYVSDEALCLDWADGSLWSYPRPLELSAWSRAAVGLAGSSDGRDVLLTAADLGARVAAAPLRLTHVVLPARRDGTGGVSLVPAPARQAAAALLSRSFNHWRDPARAFELVHQVVPAVRVWRLRLGSPTAAAALLSDHC